MNHVIRRIDARRLPAADVLSALPRAGSGCDVVTDQVQRIVDQVRVGDTATMLDLAERFDGIRPKTLRVPDDVLQAAKDSLDPAVREALQECITRARIVHRTQRRTESTATLSDGATVTGRWLPVQRVGLYVPGGRAVYPSSVVMNVVPAQEAGVESLAIASPPQRTNGGWPHSTVLAAAVMLGVEEVYAAGGAQAIAMFAFGVRDGETLGCPPVRMVTGPGNAYVAAAKRLLRGVVGVDADAGPTEIAILADDSADADSVAADLISQAEHDVMAASVLVTTSPSLAEGVEQCLTARIPRTKHATRIATALAGPQSGIVLVDDLAAGIDVVNHYGAEHLEIHTHHADEVARGVRSAGAIFVGRYSPVSLGDYCAGSNHVLPTGGTAAFSSGLSVQTFLRGVQVICYTHDALWAVADRVIALANAEDLPAHGEAVAARFQRDGPPTSTSNDAPTATALHDEP